MVGEFEVNQEDNDTDEVDGFDDFQEEVYDDSAGRQTDHRMPKTKNLYSWGGWESELRRATTSAWARIGGAPICTKWARVNKGTSFKPIVRVKLAARDFETNQRNPCSHPRHQ